MKTFLGIAFWIGLYFLWQFLVHSFAEWGGAYGRWRRGEPLRASEYNMFAWKERHDCETRQIQQRKADLRYRHDLDPYVILNEDFRREFEFLGIGEDIYSEVKAASGYQCAACGRKFALRRRKPLLHVDHIKPRKHHPHLLYVRSNLQVLCRSCNAHKSAYDGDDWKEVVAARRRATIKKKRSAREQQNLDS